MDPEPIFNCREENPLLKVFQAKYKRYTPPKICKTIKILADYTTANPTPKVATSTIRTIQQILPSTVNTPP